MKPSHPLAAHIAERYAWSLMDQWKVEEASKQFQAAYHIRLTNKEDQNPLCRDLSSSTDRHGMAMASRYRGNLDAARRTYKTVVDEIKTALADAQRQQGAGGLPTCRKAADRQPAPRRYHPALRERLSNSLERWADCELYSGAASAGKVNLLQAAESLRPGPQRRAASGAMPLSWAISWRSFAP